MHARILSLILVIITAALLSIAIDYTPAFVLFLIWNLLVLQWPAHLALLAKHSMVHISRIAWVSGVLNLLGLLWFFFHVLRLRALPNAYFDGTYDSFLPHFGDALRNSFHNVWLVFGYGFILLICYGCLEAYVNDQAPAGNADEHS